MVIRPSLKEDSLGIARVLVDTWRTTFKGMVPQTYLDAMNYDSFEKFLSSSYGSYFTVVADDGGQVVAFASGGATREKKYPFEGELYSIFVRDEYQGQGVGKNMVVKVAQHLVDAGIKDMVVWVLKDNPSRQFYELLNGELYTERDTTIGGRSLKEVSYVWRDFHKLLT